MLNAREELESWCTLELCHGKDVPSLDTLHARYVAMMFKKPQGENLFMGTIVNDETGKRLDIMLAHYKKKWFREERYGFILVSPTTGRKALPQPYITLRDLFEELNSVSDQLDERR